MNIIDIEKVRQDTLTQLVIEENTPEVEKRREEYRQNMVFEKQQENDRLDSHRKTFESNKNIPPSQPYYYPPNQYWLSPEDKLLLEFYEAQCAEKIKKRASIVFSDHLVQTEGGPSPSPNVVLELTKWVKIALSKKKNICSICKSRTHPQRCTKECFFFTKKTGCLAGQLCHLRHGSSSLVDSVADTDSVSPPLFLNTG